MKQASISLRAAGVTLPVTDDTVALEEPGGTWGGSPGLTEEMSNDKTERDHFVDDNSEDDRCTLCGFDFEDCLCWLDEDYDEQADG